ncbi:hypothetical protein [Brevundimonas subvibrioides]|uniref:Uncharacterized protein n=1 Tax=Brevundimonas subvibrioides (strain ATCC 15264 / DSM 4735 / LMG 14903 / NBRC 16000 / CB 81) TaxID=633149 RepID=D9QMJ6_BRESC|nr:hypothetical protein [Brevundimonas subvibrioides]ADL00166.1 conserved hypothetical protein [Brevundimonas subvibrioides ATCC 15264]
MPSGAENQTPNPENAPSVPSRRRRRDRAWATGAIVSALAHLALLLVLLATRPAPLIFSDPAPANVVQITLEPPPRPVIPPEPAPEPDPGSLSEPAAATVDPAPTPTPPRPTPPLPRPRPPRTPPPPQVERLVASVTPAPPASRAVGLTAGQLVGAAVAGSGSGDASGSGSGTGSGSGSGDGSGGQCDMIRRIQDAIREDADVVAAATRAQATLPSGARALLVWNGDWVQTPGEAGRGLAGVRQAIALEIAFAPAACRRQTVTGLVLLTLGDGGPRLALGTGRWRWSDLTGAG